MITVAVVDDEALVRSGFELILGAAPDIEVVATVNGPQAVEAITRLQPQVVLLDIQMPGRNGLEVLEDLRAMSTPPIIAILTTFDSRDHIAQALGRGASGFLVKDTDPVQLPSLIRSLTASGVVISPQVSRTMIANFGRSSDSDAVRLVATLSTLESDPGQPSACVPL